MISKARYWFFDSIQILPSWVIWVGVLNIKDGAIAQELFGGVGDWAQIMVPTKQLRGMTDFFEQCLGELWKYSRAE